MGQHAQLKLDVMERWQRNDGTCIMLNRSQVPPNDAVSEESNDLLDNCLIRRTEVEIITLILQPDWPSSMTAYVRLYPVCSQGTTFRNLKNFANSDHVLDFVIHTCKVGGFICLSPLVQSQMGLLSMPHVQGML